MEFSKDQVVWFGDEEWTIKGVVSDEYLLENPAGESFVTSYTDLCLYNPKDEDMTGVTNDDR